MKYAKVLEVYLNDDADFGPYSIQALLKQSSKSQRIVAKPLNINSKNIPVVGEYVCIQKAPSDKLSPIGSGQSVFYYSDPISLQGNVNNNILENAAKLEGNVVGGDYESTSLGIPNPSTPSNSDKKNKEFTEVSNLSQLQPYAGDIIYEGRFGQSIRFGYTPTRAESNISPSWKSTDPKSPITIIRNGAGESRGYNKFVIEDINKDDSSIWLGSKQTIGLTPSNSFTLGVTPTNLYKNPQIVLNSDRIVLNSKSDSVLISGDKSVNVSTPNWKADMDVIFSQLESITDALLQLAPAITAATAGPFPVPSLTTAGPRLLSTITQVKTQLTLMKQ
jgi:hypothetical protein